MQTCCEKPAHDLPGPGIIADHLGRTPLLIECVRKCRAGGNAIPSPCSTTSGFDQDRARAYQSIGVGDLRYALSLRSGSGRREYLAVAPVSLLLDSATPDVLSGPSKERTSWEGGREKSRAYSRLMSWFLNEDNGGNVCFGSQTRIIWATCPSAATGVWANGIAVAAIHSGRHRSGGDQWLQDRPARIRGGSEMPGAGSARP